MTRRRVRHERHLIAWISRLAASTSSIVTYWYTAAPLVDHDGGDEDDQLVAARQFDRAARKPGARVFRERDRLYVVRDPELRPLVMVSEKPLIIIRPGAISHTDGI